MYKKRLYIIVSYVYACIIADFDNVCEEVSNPPKVL
jgi:hypothetical protein